MTASGVSFAFVFIMVELGISGEASATTVASVAGTLVGHVAWFVANVAEAFLSGSSLFLVCLAPEIPVSLFDSGFVYIHRIWISFLCPVLIGAIVRLVGVDVPRVDFLLRVPPGCINSCNVILELLEKFECLGTSGNLDVHGSAEPCFEIFH